MYIDIHIHNQSLYINIHIIITVRELRFPTVTASGRQRPAQLGGAARPKKKKKKKGKKKKK